MGGNDLKLWLQEDGSLSLRKAHDNELVWSSYTGGRGTAPYSFVMPDPGFPMVVDSKNKNILIIAVNMLMQKKQKLSISGGEIAVNQIGLQKMISMETFLRFTKNTRLSMMDKR